MPSLIDILPPEAQALLGGLALLLAVAGLILATTGIKIARFTISLLLGLITASLAAWLIPAVIDVSPITAGLIGFAFGALTGALAFKLLQGLTLALCLGLAAGTAYYHLNIQPLLHSSPTTQSAPLSLDQQLIPLDALPPAPSTRSAKLPASPAPSLTHLAAATLQSLSTRWNAIPKLHQKRLLLITLSVASFSLFIAFIFPRRTTWIITSLLGSFMLLVGLQTLLHLYAPQYESYFPAQPRSAALTLSLLTLTTLLIQHSLFWSRKKRLAPPPPTPVPAIPTPAPSPS